MSTAWRGPVVLLEEPDNAFWGRLGYRVMVTVVIGLAASYMPYWYLALPIWILAGVALVFAGFTVVNRIRNNGALLVHTAAGSIEWPQSIQEVLLRRPVEFVAAPQIEVTDATNPSTPSKADPRITLSDGEHTIPRVPLHGVEPQVFVEGANELLAGRGTTLVYIEPEPEAEPEAELEAGSATDDEAAE